MIASFNALKYMKTSGILPNVEIPGFEDKTPEQIFFMAFGTARKSSLEDNLNSTFFKMFRVVGILRNSADFAEAFKCQPGAKMNPEEKCHMYSER